MIAQSDREVFSIQGESPAEPSTVALGIRSGLSRFDTFNVLARIGAPTGGPLDVYLQRRIGPNRWADYERFPQVEAGESADFVFETGAGKSPIQRTEIKEGAKAPSMRGNVERRHPGDALRVVAKAGRGTTAGAPVLVLIVGWIAAARNVSHG